ncbi:MAG TPA: tetratricopeptide repeat protein [Gemmatimonadales bacterium]|nr:tetratricopeptide repeat protein [Gemmatimonadales bacterium]
MVIGPWRIVLVAVACVLVSDGIAGQKPPPLQNAAASRRPRLSSAADTNDWTAYFDYGVAQLRSDPRGAERAFYWAARLEPGRAEPLYGRWVAYWMRFPGWFEEYVRERPRVLESPNVLQVDSLYQRALLRNPLMPRTLHVLLYDQLPGEWRRDPLTIAMLAYGAGKFDVAAAAFGKLVREDPAKHYRLRYWQALCFVAAQRYDSAAAEVAALVEELRQRDEKKLAHWYESKELLDYGLGLLHLALGNRAAARVVLQQALVENLAFYPAHAALADVALNEGDQPAALREYAQAVELGGDDAGVRHRYAQALADAGRPGEAELQVRQVIELEPLFAAPYFTLGKVLEARGLGQQALAAYRDYVQRAPSLAPLVTRARARIAALSGMEPDSGRQP